VFDPLAAAVGIGLLGPVVAGPLVAYGLGRLPAAHRRTIEWALILGAVAVAIGADLHQEGPGAGGGFVYLLAALPGFITYLVWRSQLATALVSLVPMYFVIAILTRGRETFRPELALDRAIPLEPAWMLVYGSLYVFAMVLPLLVLRDRGLIRRAMQAYLLVILVSYAVFLLYPTAGPRTEGIERSGFMAWSLQALYSMDTPYNCFPSLHVAYSFVAALACRRVHRGVGRAALAWATLIAISTLFTKQHYIADVIGGTLAAFAADALFLRGYAPASTAERDRRLAPRRAAAAAAIYGVMVAAVAVAYHFQS
jgi:membrane-associated phospholipid phosphatase